MSGDLLDRNNRANSDGDATNCSPPGQRWGLRLTACCWRQLSYAIKTQQNARNATINIIIWASYLISDLEWRSLCCRLPGEGPGVAVSRWGSGGGGRGGIIFNFLPANSYSEEQQSLPSPSSDYGNLFNFNMIITRSWLLVSPNSALSKWRFPFPGRGLKVDKSSSCSDKNPEEMERKKERKWS